MRIAELSGDDQTSDSSRTFVFYEEGHTLGNALRYIISSYPEVSLCGYTVPHPSETRMHFRIQAYAGHNALDILKRGLQDLEKMCDHVLVTFDKAMEDHKSAAMSSESEVT